jgi:hypothetical protein
MAEDQFENSSAPGITHDDWIVVRVIVISGVFGLALVALGYLAAKSPSGIFAALTLISPFASGVLAGYLWRRLPRSLTNFLMYALAITGVQVLGAAAFLGEGVICLIIIAPLIAVIIWLGILLGHGVAKSERTSLKVSVGALVVLAFIGDLLSPHIFQNKVTDDVLIRATPDKIWPYVASFPPITETPSFWLFRVGLPHPVATTVDSNVQGAGRKCIFSSGVVFDERMTVYDPNHELTFDIIHQPADPEILGHIDLERGQFLLIDNHDGTTTLRGSSWYALRVFPVWYFNPWAESITSHVHLHVMEHIKRLAEATQ